MNWTWSEIFLKAFLMFSFKNVQVLNLALKSSHPVDATRRFCSTYSALLEKYATIAVCIYTWCASGKASEDAKDTGCRLTFLQWSSLVLLQPLDCNGFQAYSGGRIFFEHVPHVLLAENEEVRVADRAHAGCSPVTCVDVAIYWLSGCIKLSYVTARKIDLRRSYSFAV